MNDAAASISPGTSQLPTGSWLTELDRLFAATLDRVPDGAFTAPTSLPGWTTAHVIAHVHFNALALCRLLSWARTGEEASMYSSAAQRAEEIEQGATTDPSQLRSMVKASATRFSTEFGELTDEQRARIVVTAQGRHIPSSELAWLRCRELGVHAVDLMAGTRFADLPEGFVEAVVQEIVAKRLANSEGPVLAEWFTGRNGPPAIGRWL